MTIKKVLVRVLGLALVAGALVTVAGLVTAPSAHAAGAVFGHCSGPKYTQLKEGKLAGFACSRQTAGYCFIFQQRP